MHMRQRSRTKVKALPAHLLAAYEFFFGASTRLAYQVICHLAAIIAVAFAILAFSGCSPRYMDMPVYWPIASDEYENYGPGRFKTTYLAKQIDEYYRGTNPGPIGVSTFVNIDDLYVTSTFGRMVSEQLMSELTMRGFDVVELRHSDALQFLDSTGEFALSRDVRVVRPERNLSAVIVGTYVVSPQRVYVNARLLDPSSSLVLSAGSVEMSKTKELGKLLRGGSAPQSLERIPVRHLGYAAYPVNVFDPVRRNQWAQEEGAGTNIQLPPAPRGRSRLQQLPPRPADTEAAPAPLAPQVSIQGSSQPGATSAEGSTGTE